MALKNFLNLLMPLFCEGCEAMLEERQKRFCDDCLQDLELLSPYDFTRIKGSFDRFGAIWSYHGAAKRLITRYKEENRAFDSTLFANFLLIQLERLSWVTPDLIVSVPQDPFKKIWKRFDPIGAIAKCLSLLLDIPVFEGIKRHGGRASQSTLSKSERETLDESLFYLTSPEELRGKKLLLLDDVFTTGTTLEAVSQTLWRGSPLTISALTLARVDLE